MAGVTISDVPDSTVSSFIQDRAMMIRALGKQTTENVVAIGKALAEVKEVLPHGQWLPWLEREFGWSDRTARNFMSAATMPKSETVSDLAIDAGALYKIAAPSTPEPVRKEALRRAEQGEHITRTVVAEIITEHTPRPKDAPIAPLSRKRVWNCQLPKTFRAEMLRIIRSYEKNNPPISALTVIHRNGTAIEIQVAEENDE